MLNRNPKFDEIFHANVDSDDGKRIRLCATLTQDGWAAGVLDLSTGGSFALGQWPDLESAKCDAEGYMRLFFPVSADLVWIAGPPD